MNLPDDYPIDKYKVGFEWVEPWRYQRIWQVLEPQVEHELEDSVDLQRDYRSLPAIEIIRRIPEAASGPAVEMLRNWDGILLPDSGPAALYMIWVYRHLRQALAAEVLPQDPGLLSPLDHRSVIRMMTEDRMRATVISSLSSAYADAQSL